MTYCCCLVTELCPNLRDPIDCSIPGLSVPHHHLKFAQVHVHGFSDAIQSSHPLTPSSPSALNPSQHQGLFEWANCLPQMTKMLEFQLQHQSFQQVFRVDFPWDWLVWSPCCQKDSQEFLNTTVQTRQFFSTQLSLIAQLVKNRSATQETPVLFLCWEDPPEKG